MAMLFIAVPSFMCVNCLLVHGKHLYSTLAHFLFLFDVVCTEVHHLPIKKTIFKNLSEYCYRCHETLSLYKCGEC